LVSFFFHHHPEAPVRSTLLLSLSLIAACAKGPDTPQAVRTDSAGIELVANPGPDRALSFAVTPVDTLLDGGADTTLQSDANQLLVAADARGRLVIADGKFTDRRILRRELDGSLHQIGRRGGGPGEYEGVGSLTVAPSGEVLIGDYNKQGFVRFDSADAPLPMIRWSDLGKGFSRGGAYVGGALVAQLTDMGRGAAQEQPLPAGDDDAPRPMQVLVAATATDTLRVASVEEPPMKMTMFPTCKVGFSQPPLFFPGLLWTGNAEQLAVVSTGDYRIDIWKQGKLVRSIRRDFTPREVTRAMAEQEMSPGMTISFGGPKSCTIPPNEIVDNLGFAPKLPAIKRLTMAADGTLWVERWTIKGEPLQRDIFDPTGAYLGTLSGEAVWPQGWLANGTYVAVTANEDSLPVVVRYGVGGATREE
jgi:hypothetical protein